ncbi:MAG: cation-transporting P-type ATPase, partial [Sulfolobales archaeon]
MRGLSSGEVAERLKRFGFNKVPERKENLLVEFAKKFTGLTAFVIEAAAIISFTLGRYVDFAIMVLLLLVNAVIGVVHGYRAGRAVELLKSKLKIVVKVLRDGEWRDVEAEYLVPDDVVKLS